jgi:NADH-quinone oxidoreductase subunit N
MITWESIWLLILCVDMILTRKSGGIVAFGSVIGLLAPTALITWIALTPDRPQQAFSGMLVVDQYALFFDYIFVLIGAGTVLVSYDYVRKYMNAHASEFYMMIFFSLLGAMFMASSRELITIYISLELTSFPLYVMAGMLRKSIPGDAASSTRSAEAATKYVLLGAMSSAILLYGMALLYGITASTDLGEIAQSLAKQGLNGPNSLVLLLSVIFIFAGFGFKISAVPFHMWAPDIYQGAPTPGTLFFSVASKTAGLAALIRVLVEGGLIQSTSFYLWGLLAIVSVLSMTLGNVVAIVQDDIKRMMAYSSIAQVGYILVGLAASAYNPSNRSTNAAVLVFIAVYVATNIGAFAGIIALANATGGEAVRDFNGLFKRSPALAFGLSLCLLSLAGIPPLAGALSKIVMFIAAWQQGGFFPALVIVALINSVISIVYYVGVVYNIFVTEPQRDDRLRVSPALSTALAVSVLSIIALTIFFQPLLNAGGEGALSLFK